MMFTFTLRERDTVGKSIDAAGVTHPVAKTLVTMAVQTTIVTLWSGVWLPLVRKGVGWVTMNLFSADITDQMQLLW